MFGPNGKQPKLSLMGDGKLGTTWEGLPCGSALVKGGMWWCWDGRVRKSESGVGYVLKTDAGVACWWLLAGCHWRLWKADFELNY